MAQAADRQRLAPVPVDVAGDAGQGDMRHQALAAESQEDQGQHDHPQRTGHRHQQPPEGQADGDPGGEPGQVDPVDAASRDTEGRRAEQRGQTIGPRKRGFADVQSLGDAGHEQGYEKGLSDARAERERETKRQDAPLASQKGLETQD